MVNVRTRADTGRLFLDFRYRGVRCREQTALDDTPANRRMVEGLAKRIQREITKGTFTYRGFFPDSARAAQFDPRDATPNQSARAHAPHSLSSAGPTPTFGMFAETWFEENRPRWRDTYVETIRGTLDHHLLPRFAHQLVDAITRADLLAFRADLAAHEKNNGETLSPSRVNHIMTPLRMLLAEASEHFNFVSPFRNIKPLSLPKIDIQPFSLDEVNTMLDTVRTDWHPYLATKFFTGMRTGEINALEWKHIDFDHDLILVRQSIAKGKIENTKTQRSIRDIPMVPLVRAALQTQRTMIPDGCRWVFAQGNGKPINVANFTNRIWHPLLRHLGLDARRPYQTRHTAAALMLAAGENPEWVARMLGHANTEMLFRVYSRYVPNLTRTDGRAFTGLVNAAAQGAERNERSTGNQRIPASLAMLSRKELEQLVQRLATETNEDQSNG